MIQIGLYGGGAILICEMVRWWGGGWPSILLLGAAYGAIEEGLLEPSWFTPALRTHPCGVALGVFWTYAAWNIGYHAVFSIAIPILLTELAFPAWRDKPWLGRTGMSVLGAVYAVNAAAIGLLWWTFVQPTVLHLLARVHPVQQGAASYSSAFGSVCQSSRAPPRLQTWVTRTWRAWDARVECRDEPGLVLGTHDEPPHRGRERTQAHPFRPIQRDLDQPGAGAIDKSGASPVVDSAENAESERTTQFASVQWPGRCNIFARDRGLKCPPHVNVDR
jgi:hypothetical protein